VVIVLLVPALHASARAASAASEPLVGALRHRLETPSVVCGSAYLDSALFADFYPVGTAVPFWVTPSGPGARAVRFRTLLRSAGQEGLVPANYRLVEIENHWAAREPEALACLDLLLTDAFRRYASDVRNGRLDPREADPAWYLRASGFDPANALRAAVDEDAFAKLLRDLPPPHAGYRRLRDALARYESMARDGGWVALPAGPTLEPGVQGKDVRLLRVRLIAEGDLSGLTTGGEHFDGQVAEAVRRFQRRHGLSADGVVGPRTRAVMSVPIEERLAQIRRTMERWRWLPRHLGEAHVLVNTAGFRVDVMEGARSVLSMRVIVGTPDQATPSFGAMIEAMIINPYWNVPLRIARDKLLPRQQRDPMFFSARGFRVFPNGGASSQEIDPAGVDWRRVSTEPFPFRVRQEPGERNSMGRVAFVLPNPFDIFLHDTPERALFERDTRVFSEGCVRIERFMALALYSLRGTSEWDESRITAEIDSLQHRRVTLPRPLPVYVLYLTSWVDDGGIVHFADDVYRREGVLSRYYPATKRP